MNYDDEFNISSIMLEIEELIDTAAEKQESERFIFLISKLPFFHDIKKYCKEYLEKVNYK